MQTLLVRKIWIDKMECLNHALCQSEVPEGVIIEDEEEGIIIDQGAVEKNQETLEALLEAEMVCPMEAFRVELADGSIHNVSSKTIQKFVDRGAFKWA